MGSRRTAVAGRVAERDAEGVSPEMVAELSRRAKAIEELMIEKAQAAEAELGRELTKRVPHERGEGVLVLEAVHVVQVVGDVDQGPSQDERGRGARPGVGTSLRSGRLPVES